MANDPTWIDYLQAISAPAAVLVAAVAIWSTLKIEYDRQRIVNEEKRLRARSLALSIFPELLELQAKVSGSRSLLERSARENFNNRQFNELKRLQLEVPPYLKRSTDQLWLLGENAASPILQAVSVSGQYDRMVEKWVEDLNRGRQLEPGPEKILARFASHLEVIEKLILEAKDNIGSIHDGTK
jgi:hypothetical protein